MSADRIEELKRRRRQQWLEVLREQGLGYLFMAPWAIGFLVFMAIPLGWSLYLTFNKVKLTPEGFDYAWRGLGNFRDALLLDHVYPVKLLTYIQEVILMIPIIVIFALFVSLLLNQSFPGRFLFRAIFFLPVIFATGQVLTELFSQGAGELPFIDQYNVKPLVQQYFGPRFAEPILGILGKVVIILWYSGVQILIFIAGFQTISKSVYEAVRIDGATPWESFWKITLPGAVPFIGLNAIYTIVDLFTFPLNPVLEEIKSNMFKPDTGYGYASALAWIYFTIIFLLLSVVFLLIRKAALRRRRV
ncbi:carbohydrate ABC transporter permease [Paenibacillus spongiae]|uniref:Sugar ABC transporter permease n=1 Tax=Paenibacillus spongiae TaxID=2909671 RepID=A0ABY5SL28_9BACL|nr:sugar ABC transporter permease [Paenibacillus spongiae]UVI32953.1 sugar ABC transporter permease [Paenibacillus spongiae]